MTVLEKIEFLCKARNLTERQLLAQYHTHFGLAKRIRAGYVPEIKDVKKLCKLLGFDSADFLDETSSISESLKPGEHHIKMVQSTIDESRGCFEDYPHEDNSRYEEKD